MMMIPSLVPWSLALIGTLIEQRKKLSLKAWIENLKNDEWLLLGVIWATSCPVLLFFAKQYTATYNMSSIPGFAFLMAVIWKRATDSSEPWTLFSRTTTRVLFVAMALTLATTAVIFFSRAAVPSLWQTSFTVAVAISLLITAIRFPTFKDSMGAIGALALLSAIGYGTTMVAGDAYLSSHRSTKNILAYAASLSKGETLKIGFADNLPFSARFYSSLMSHPSVTVTQVNQDQLPTAQEDLIIVRKNKGDMDVVSADQTQEKIGEFGRWRVYRRKSLATP